MVGIVGGVLHRLRITGWMDLCRCTRVRRRTGQNSSFDRTVLSLHSVPIAVDIVFRRRRVVDFLKWSLISGVTTLVRPHPVRTRCSEPSSVLSKVPLTLVDSYYYGQLVIAPLNHIRYNIFSKHGPTLYGKRKWNRVEGYSPIRYRTVDLLCGQWFAELQHRLPVRHSWCVVGSE